MITSVFVVFVAKVPIARNPHLMLDHIDLDSPSLDRKAFLQNWLQKRMKATGKIEILDGAKKAQIIP